MSSFRYSHNSVPVSENKPARTRPFRPRTAQRNQSLRPSTGRTDSIRCRDKSRCSPVIPQFAQNLHPHGRQWRVFLLVSTDRASHLSTQANEPSIPCRTPFGPIPPNHRPVIFATRPSADPRVPLHHRPGSQTPEQSVPLPLPVQSVAAEVRAAACPGRCR